jgi:hypothetical protein
MIEIWTERTMPAAKDLVEDSKIWKMGTPVGELAAASMSTMQKQTATRKMKPVIAPIHTAQMIAFGASFERLSSLQSCVPSHLKKVSIPLYDQLGVVKGNLP